MVKPSDREERNISAKLRVRTIFLNIPFGGEVKNAFKLFFFFNKFSNSFYCFELV